MLEKVRQHSTPERVQTKKSYVIAIDFGSSNIKVGSRTFETSTGKPDKFSNKTFGRYQNNLGSTYRTSKGTASDKSLYSYLSIDLRKKNIFSDVKERWQETHDVASSQTDCTEVITAMTGLTNSLVARYEDKIIVLLDEPSLRGKLTDEQTRILNEIIGEKGAQKQSTVRKLLALKNDPKLVKKLFGNQVSFADLQFSTVLGALKSIITDDKSFVVPFDDLKGFGRKDLTVQEVQKMMQDLKIDKKQISFYESKYAKAPNGEIIYTVNDFSGEAAVISELRKNGEIIKNSIVVGLDSVVKIVTNLPLGTEGFFPEYGERYTTQRMGANINTKLMKSFLKILHNYEWEVDYKKIDDILHTAAINKIRSSYLYFPDHHNGGSTGTIYKNEDGTLIPMGNKDLIKIEDEKEKENLALGIAVGMVFGIREKIESIWEKNNLENSPIFLYGGLIYKQPGWADIIAQALPNVLIDCINISSGVDTASRLAIKELNKPISAIEHVSNPIVVDHKRDQEYQEWKKFKPSISADAI